MLNRCIRALLAGALLAVAPAALAQTAQPTATEILAGSRGNRQVVNSIQTLQLVIISKDGSSRTRTITSKIKQGEDGLSKNYVRFDEPADVAGVQFLSVQRAAAEDDQWIYMPAFEQATRISGGSRGSSFMGTDFTYEDLSVGDPDDGTHETVGKETIEVGSESVEAWKIVTIPKPELKSSYTKLETWISVADNMPRQVVFFDKKGEAIKRMTMRQVRKDGEQIIPEVTVMENLKKGSRTEIKVVEVKLNVPAEQLPDSMFDVTFLTGEG
jgi:hypothetical protein